MREFKKFKQKFNLPLNTGHGLWRENSGFILKQTKYDGSLSFGEVCVVPGFCKFDMSDLNEEVEKWCQDGRLHNFEFINSAVSCLESEIWNENLGDKHEISRARIMNSLEDSISSHQTLKLKIGINETTYEINKTLEFIKKLPASTRIRLDANESLSLDQLLLWVEALHQNPVLEFMEQPLPGIPDDALIQLVKDTGFPIALDEAVIHLGGPDKLHQLGWAGLMVVKPTLCKNWNETIDFLRLHPERCIISTVFESPFGYEALLRLCRYSKLVPGIDRSIFEGGSLELISHHSIPLFCPSASNEELGDLWLKYPK